jgi:hypothetical protein
MGEDVGEAVGVEVGRLGGTGARVNCFEQAKGERTARRTIERNESFFIYAFIEKYMVEELYRNIR